MAKYICGKNSVMDAINNNIPIIKLYLTKSPNFKISKDIKIEIVDNNYMNQLVKENHQGFIAQIKDIQFDDLNVIFKDKPEKILILDHIQDPHNFGAIIRTANASGIKHIIFPKDRAVDVTNTVIKVSSGGFVNMKFIKVSSITSTIEKLKKNNFWIYATNLDKNSVEINKASFNYPLAMIFGSEHSGISKSVAKLADQNIYIKMHGSVQSLNVSVAAGIVLFKI